MPYPGPFLEPGITKRIKRTAFLRSLVRPDKKAYREGARAATREATDYAQVNCMKYFEFQYTWGDIMLRMESDAGLRQALVHAAMARQAGEDIVVAEAASMANDPVEEVEAEVAKANLDPGMTSEIHLNLSDEE